MIKPVFTEGDTFNYNNEGGRLVWQSGLHLPEENHYQAAIFYEDTEAQARLRRDTVLVALAKQAESATVVGELPQDERAAFEAAYTEKMQAVWPHRPLNKHDVESFFKRDAKGFYVTIHSEWVGWQLGRAALTQRPTPAPSLPVAGQEPVGYAPHYLVARLKAGDSAVMVTITTKPLPGHGVNTAIFTAPVPAAAPAVLTEEQIKCLPVFYVRANGFTRAGVYLNDILAAAGAKAEGKI